jgi:hypothetical protein
MTGRKEKRIPLITNSKGGYRFLLGISPYSCGVVAVPGFEIIHVTLRELVDYQKGFELIQQELKLARRPLHALCAIELRLPEPLPFEGFSEFNKDYLTTLNEWDLLVDGQNPVARTNVALELPSLKKPSLYGFSYTIPSDGRKVAPTFVVAGAAELMEDQLLPKAIIRAGDTSLEGLQEKVAHVLQTMDTRLHSMGMTWFDVSTVNAYTVHSPQPLLVSTILPALHQAALHGLRWFYTRPPIIGLDCEMDVRGVNRQICLGG